uniref:Uncharacterized protein n=1 Tax=Steinernema glaseri TaxID=37863 RepID=A0A1I7Z356_9BILA
MAELRRTHSDVFKHLDHPQEDDADVDPLEKKEVSLSMRSLRARTLSHRSANGDEEGDERNLVASWHFLYPLL